jgi:hypothetical protein
MIADYGHAKPAKLLRVCAVGIFPYANVRSRRAVSELAMDRTPAI